MESLKNFAPLYDLIKLIYDIVKEQSTVIIIIGAVAGTIYRFWRWMFPKTEKLLVAGQTVSKGEQSATSEDNTRSSVTVRPIDSIDELRTVYSFDEEAYEDRNKQHVDNITFETFQEWWEAKPDGFMAAFDDGEPVCVIGAFPITREWAEGLLERKHDENSLHRDDIQKSDRTIWYVSGISAKDPGGKGLKSAVPKLLTETLVRWYLTNRDVLDRTPVQLVSVAVSRMGQKLLEEVQFMPKVPAKAKGEYPIYTREVSRDRLLRFLSNHPLLKRHFDGEIREELEEALRHAPPLQRSSAAFEPIGG